jgi:hypothetical protein
MKIALMVYFAGASVVAARRAWHMYFDLDKFDWAYGDIWHNFFTGVLLWPIRVLFITPLFEPSNELSGGSRSRDHREKERFRSDPPPCSLFIRYHQKEHGSCGEFILESETVESAYKKAQKTNSSFRVEAVGMLLGWLQQRNAASHEATELPRFLDVSLPPLASFQCITNDLAKSGHGKVWCVKCAQVFSPDELTAKVDDGNCGWNYERLYCPQNHLLLASESTFCDPAPTSLPREIKADKSDEKEGANGQPERPKGREPDSRQVYVGCEEFLASQRLSDLTSDEREEVWRGFGPAREQRYLSNHVDNILGASAAATLCNLASGMLGEVLEMESDERLRADLAASRKADADRSREEIKAMKDRAIWLARKAIEVYPHPVLYGRLIELLELVGRDEDAESVRDVHEKQKSAWTSRYTDELLMMSLNPKAHCAEGDG